MLKYYEVRGPFATEEEASTYDPRQHKSGSGIDHYLDRHPTAEFRD